MRFALPLGFLFLIVGCRQAPPPSSPPVETQAVDQLLALMNERLAIMHDVARWKWNEKKPIADGIRERELREAMSERGAKLGLDRHAVQWFFASQIEAAKIVQQADFDRWTSQNQEPFADVVPLATLRERINVINGKLLESLAATKDAPSAVVLERAATLLQGEGISTSVRDAATAPWRDPVR